MKTFLKETSPASAYKMFQDTFCNNELPAMLDDAFIHFTNEMNKLKTKCISSIVESANKNIKENYLDILAVCYLFKNQSVLFNLLGNYKKENIEHEINIRKAKHERKIMGDIFCNDLYQAYTDSIKKHQKLYDVSKQNIYTVEAMIRLIKELKK